MPTDRAHVKLITEIVKANKPVKRIFLLPIVSSARPANGRVNKAVTTKTPRINPASSLSPFIDIINTGKVGVSIWKLKNSNKLDKEVKVKSKV
jgi:hypothetical protein